MDIQLRPVLPGEVSLLRSVSLRSFEVPFAPHNDAANMEAYMSFAFSADRLSDELTNPASRFFFAYVGEMIAGYLKINRAEAQSDLRDPESLEIERIYVLPEYYRQGVGQVMLDEAIRVARSEKLRYVWLGVWERNPRAIQFYEKNGFMAFSSHPFMMGTDRQTDILMRLDLSPDTV